MTEQFMNREELVVWLRDAISTETQKPEDQIDYEFVDECMALLSDLVTDKYNLSEKEIRAQVRRITSANSSKVIPTKRKPVKLKRFAYVAIAAAVLICGALTAFSVSSDFRYMVKSLLKLEVGDSVETSEVTYIKNGVGTVYSDISELVEKENLNIMYPHKLPDGLEVTKVVRVETEDIVSVVFSDVKTSIRIKFNAENLDEYTNTSEVCTYNGVNFYVVIHHEYDNELICMYSVDYTNHVLYLITGQDESQIHELIQNFY